MATAERIRSNPMDSQGFSENEKMDTAYTSNQMGSTQNTLFQRHFSNPTQYMGSQDQAQSDLKKATVSTIKTIRETKTVIKENNPPRSRQSSSRIQDFEEDKTDFDSFSSEKRKNKVMKMIKNSHIEKIKNYIYLKEIDHAYDEMIRLRAAGDTASSKEMERELNSLTEDIIKSNVDAFNKTQMAKNHASMRQSRISTSQFYDSRKSRDKRDIRKSQQERMQRTITTTTRKVVNKHSEDNDEEDNQYEEENKYEDEEENEVKKSRKTKRKNKSKRASNIKKGNNKPNSKSQNNQNPNEYNQYGQNPNEYNQYSQNPNVYNQYSQNPNNNPNINPNAQNNNQFNNPNIPYNQFNNPNIPNSQFNNPNNGQFNNSNIPNSQYNNPYNNQFNNPNIPNSQYNNPNIPNSQYNNPNIPNNNQFNNPNYDQFNNPNYQNNNIPYNDPNKGSMYYQNPNNPAQSQSLSYINPDIQRSDRVEKTNSDTRQKDRYANMYDSQKVEDSRYIGSEKEKRGQKDKNRPGSSQDRLPESNHPIIHSTQNPIGDGDNNNPSQTQEGIEKVTQSIMQGKTYSTLVLSTNNEINPNDPNKIGPNSGVPLTGNEKENTQGPNDNQQFDKPKGDPLASDGPQTSSQSYQPQTMDQQQINPNVLRNPKQQPSSPNLQITTNPNNQYGPNEPNDPSGKETGRFPTQDSQNPKNNPRLMPEYPSRYGYQGPNSKKPSPKKRSPNYGPRGNYPSQNPKGPNNPRNPQRGYPKYPSRDDPRYPSRDSPQYPSRGNPRYPSRGNPLYPLRDSPQYPSRGNPRYPARGNPQYPSRDNPNDPLRDNPSNPLMDGPRNPNYPPNTDLDSRMRRPLSTRGPNPRPNDPNFGYPRRYRDGPRGRGKDITFGDSMGRSLSRSSSKKRVSTEVKIPFSDSTFGRCFACDAKCSISISGNSPNKYVPYYPSSKIERKAVTDYDAERYGYYQYSSRFSKNIQNYN